MCFTSQPCIQFFFIRVNSYMTIWTPRSIVYSYWIVSFIRNGAEIYIRTFLVVITRAIQILVRPAINLSIYRSTANGNFTAGVPLPPANSGTRSRSSSYGSTANGNFSAGVPLPPANSGTRIRSSSYGSTANGNVTAGVPWPPANSGTRTRSSSYGSTANGNVTADTIITPANSGTITTYGN